MEFLLALSQIVMVNIILSGDNAVVIALASRCLPPRQQRLAIIWGSVGALVLRVVLTLVAVVLLQIPYLQFVGGIMLIWIAGKLLLENGECGEDGIEASASLLAAVKTIVIADIIMSVDNTLAIAAIARGDYLLLGLGLALSVPLIIFGSKFLVVLMDRFPVIIYAGAGLIAWTAGFMIVEDPSIGPMLLEYVNAHAVAASITVLVLSIGVWQRRKRHGGDTAVHPDKG